MKLVPAAFSPKGQGFGRDRSEALLVVPFPHSRSDGAEVGLDIVRTRKRELEIGSPHSGLISLRF